MKFRKSLTAAALAAALMAGTVQGGIVQAQKAPESITLNVNSDSLAAADLKGAAKKRINRDKYKNKINKLIFPSQLQYTMKFNGLSFVVSSVKNDFGMEVSGGGQNIGVYGVGNELWCYKIGADGEESYAHSTMDLGSSDLSEAGKEMMLSDEDDFKFKYIRYEGQKKIDGKNYDEILADLVVDSEKVRCHIYVVPNTRRIYEVSFKVKESGVTMTAELKSISGIVVSPVFVDKQIVELTEEEAQTYLSDLFTEMLGGLFGSMMDAVE